MAAAFGLTIVKRMPYRGDPSEEWSNTYWFTGTAPSGATAFKTAADALIDREADLYLDFVEVVRAYGYDSDADDAHAVWSFDYAAAGTTVPGQFAGSGYTFPAGDQAAWIRWRVDRLSSRGKPIYLRKYYHGVPTEEDTLGTRDTVGSSWQTAANAFAASVQSGSWSTGHTITARGHSDSILSHAPSQFITIRQLRKGVRRPPP